VAGADGGVDEAFDDIAALAAGCRFSDCQHDREPGCAVRAAIDRGELTEGRLASQRKLEREAAHAERKVDPRAAAEERKRWKSIHKSVNKHMDSKYGGEWR
jgi:ribosome biogenesis GTPase